MKVEKAAEKRAKKEAAKEEKRKKKEKPYSIHVETRNRFMKTIIWTVLIFFVILGAFSFATREDSASVRKTLTKAVTNINQSSSSEERASSLALAFIYDYFSYSPDAQDTYNERINAYAPEGTTFELPTHSATTSVLTASIKDIASDGGGNVDITVQAKIQSSGIMHITNKVKDKNGKEEEKVTDQAQTSIRLLNYKVAVNVKDGNCAVVSEPLLVADENIAKRVSAPGDLTGISVTDAEEKTVSVLAGNFLKAYYGSNRNELSYFVTSDFGSTATVGEDIRYKEITDINVVGTQTEGYEAEVKYTISDNMIDQSQKVYLTVVKGEENRLYVDKLSTRK